MIKEAIDKILGLAAPNFHEQDGVVYSDKVWRPIGRGEQSPIETATLDGLISMEEDLPNWPLINPFYHVESHTDVWLVATMCANGKYRVPIAHAKYSIPGFKFNAFMPLEQFIIGFNANFLCAVGDFNAVINFISNLDVESKEQFVDNGTSQTVAVRKGITQIEKKDTPSPCLLYPYRTFPEISQPSGTFILRLMGGNGTSMQAALFNADNGAWGLAAVSNIREFLKTKTKLPVIA